MEHFIAREDRHGCPSQPRPDDRRLAPPPWSLDLLLAVDRIRDHALSPDGRAIAFVWDRGGTSDLWLIPSDGAGWPVRLTVGRPQQTYWTDQPPEWNRDSSALVYEAGDEIHLIKTTDGLARRLTDHGHIAAAPVFGPPGERIYHLSKRGGLANVCVTTVDGDWPIALTRDKIDASDPRPSPKGGAIAFVNHPRDDLNRSEICLVDCQGGAVRRLTGAPEVWDQWPRWSPDGDRLAYLSNASGWRQLCLLDPSGGQAIRLTTEAADVHQPSWSPDGSRIAYVADRDGAGDLCLVDLKAGTSGTLRAAGGWHSYPQWSPDGLWLTAEFGSPTAPPDLWRIEAASGAARPLTNSRPAALGADRLVSPETVYFPSSEGSSIPALLYRPAKASQAAPCPAVVYPHGGPTSDYPRRWDLQAQWLTAKGYAVLAPDYRGSTGHGTAHQHALHGRWGEVDTDDMLAAADFLAGLGWVDDRRLGILGASYGAYLALLALARDPHPAGRYRCGAMLFGDCDILTSWAQADRIGREDCERQMGHPADNHDRYRRASPVHDVERIRAPLLILHGQDDDRVHPQQSEQLVEALTRAGKDFEFVLYKGEGHGFLGADVQRHMYSRLERFLDWHLL